MVYLVYLILQDILDILGISLTWERIYMQKYGEFESFEEQVYYTAIGQAIPNKQVAGVIDQFGDKGMCHQYYDCVRDAYDRICFRLGLCDSPTPQEMPEDSDLNEILNGMDNICRDVAMEMFRCGAMFSKEEK